MASNKALPDYETTQMISLPPNTKQRFYEPNMA